MSYDRVSEPTLASTWHAASGSAITDELLDGPPDVFALTNVVLAGSAVMTLTSYGMVQRCRPRK